MPTYEYKCMDCGYFFEVFQSITEAPLKTCPKCKGNLKRLIGAGSGPIFKGSGFYHTDYKLNSTKHEKKDSVKKSDSKTESSIKEVKSNSDKSDKK